MISDCTSLSLSSPLRILWHWEAEHWDIVTLWHCDIEKLSIVTLWHCDIEKLSKALNDAGSRWRLLENHQSSEQPQPTIISDQIFTNKDSPSVKYIYVSRGTRLGSSTNIETFEMSSFNDKYIAHIICLTVRGAVHFRVFCHHNFSPTSPL